MKQFKIFIVLLFICINTFTLTAQIKSGLYLTAQDYINHNLSYTNSNKIQLNELFASAKIKIIDNGKTISLNKTQIFGYHDKGNNDYRFYKNELYQIIAYQPWLVYKGTKLNSLQNGKGGERKVEYFFSKTQSSELQILSTENLKKTFPDNLKFHLLLETIKKDNELVYYDSELKRLKVIYLYEQSLK
jgi:hypothetical protein